MKFYQPPWSTDSSKKDEENLLIQKKKNTESFEFPRPMPANHPYVTSPFYRLHYSTDKNYIPIFVDLKNKLKRLGIKFPVEKRDSEGVVILMTKFLKELAAAGYVPGQHEKGLECLKAILDPEVFSLKYKEESELQLFMAAVDSVLSLYNRVINEPFENSTEKYVDYLSFIDGRGREDFKLIQNIDDISEDEIVVKKVAHVVRMQGDEAIAKFKLENELNRIEEQPAEVKLSALEEFEKTFGPTLGQNEHYLENMAGCLELMLNTAKTNDQIYDALMNYLDFNVEAIFFLMERREQISKDVNEELKIEDQDRSSHKDQSYAAIADNVIMRKDNKKKSKNAPKIPPRVLMRLGIGVKESDKELNIQEKIQMRRAQEARVEDEYEEGTKQIDFMRVDERYLNKFRMTRVEKSEFVLFTSKPILKNEMYLQTEKGVVTELFPEYLHDCFNDGPTLNKLQTIIYPAMFSTDENILCSAPTGSGKTNVALMGILRALHKHFDPETKTVSNNFKVVYISPLKALATEIVGKFAKKLGCLGVRVRELTGDISLTKKEIAATHIIVSTPEKWDVITRKSEDLNMMFSVLIIDEIHLLDEVRGRTIECLVARTLQLINNKQCRVRFIGLSATLPNYKDVARFLNVNKNGLFYFDESFRPVPLEKKFIGVKKIEQLYAQIKQESEDKKSKSIGVKKGMTRLDYMNLLAYDMAVENLKIQKQVLVFVHSRKETFKLAQFFIERAIEKGELKMLNPSPNSNVSRRVDNVELKALVDKGIGCHNAGLKRKDRSAIEKAFCAGDLSIVVCTATLAWGINMPCHCVIIKGTDFYEAGHGYKSISLLDVQQIFGRAGRPQFDDRGLAILITKNEDLNHFVSMLSYVKPIESMFLPFVADAMLAEIVLGNICSLPEVLSYIKHTFFYIRFCKNPDAYGLKSGKSPDEYLFEMIYATLENLSNLRLIRFDPASNAIEYTELGRIASHYYVTCETIETLCHYLGLYEEDEANKLWDIDEQNLLAIIAQAKEFEQITAKFDEEVELAKLKKQFSFIEIHDDFKAQKGDKDSKDKTGTLTTSLEKIILLFWGYFNGVKHDNYSLTADTMYIVQNGSRIIRCLLDIAIMENAGVLAEKILVWTRYLENCVDELSSPLRMFCLDNYERSGSAMKSQNQEVNRQNYLKGSTCAKIEKFAAASSLDIAALRDDFSPLENLHFSEHQAKLLKQAINAYPQLDIEFEMSPVAQTIIKVVLYIKPMMRYNKTWNYAREAFWVFVLNDYELLHHSQFLVDPLHADLRKLAEVGRENCLVHSFFLPFKDAAQEYLVKIMSDRFVECDFHCTLDLASLQMNFGKMEFTNLLDLEPLRLQVLHNPKFELLYDQFIFHLNPIQTQLFFPLYHTDENVLVGAPTGSGKTVLAELAMLRVFRLHPQLKVVYVAPYKALVKERLKDWGARLGMIGYRVEELSGDYTPNTQALARANVIVTTPEKWDGVTRSWATRRFIQQVKLVIFDEIHLLGQDRGPVIEVIVSRMNYMSQKTAQRIRLVGLSTAIANSEDVAGWFGVKPELMFNFRPNVRPVPIEIHFRGFPEKNYCPRMNSMNKPAYMDIKKFAQGAPVLIFVSSRRQTRITAFDLISLSTSDNFQAKSPFLRMSDDETELILSRISDVTLKQTLSFGIGIHHAGLVKSDRSIVEDLFVNSKIQILIATSTLAWGVNFPARLVIIKGTEFFDPKSLTYIDMPITDVLQMIGRAGRPQFNEKGYACVYVEKGKKNFYRKYINDPFPLESAFKSQILEHINAEISSETIKSKQDCVEYLSWTYFFRRLIRNPSFYGVPNGSAREVQSFLLKLVDDTVTKLAEWNCVEIADDGLGLTSTRIGQIASFYYLKPSSAGFLGESTKDTLSHEKMIEILSEVEEFADVPVRHTEDEMNKELEKLSPFRKKNANHSLGNTKAYYLIMAYLFEIPLPIRDYITDTKLVLEQTFRIIAAIADLCALNKNLDNVITCVHLLQMMVQGVWISSSALVCLPCLGSEHIAQLAAKGVEHLCQMQHLLGQAKLVALLEQLTPKLSHDDIKHISKEIERLPNIEAASSLFKLDASTGEVDRTADYRFQGGEEAQLEINFKLLNAHFKPEVRMKKLSKDKDASWWVIVGSSKTNSVLAIKKCDITSPKTIRIRIPIPKIIKKKEVIEIYVMSDAYIGLDQVMTIDLAEYKTKSN